MRVKRKKGAPLGNQNARKHGFYASTLTLPQACEFWNILNLGGVEPELVALRVRLISALRAAPGNRRILAEASKLLAKWYRSKHRLDKKENAVIKKYLRTMLEAVSRKTDDFDETNRISTPENEESFSASELSGPAAE